MKVSETIRQLEKMLFELHPTAKGIYDAIWHLKKIPDEAKPFSTGSNRRRGLSKSCLLAIEYLKTANLNEITNWVKNTYPIDNEVNLISKVSTHMKRLESYGHVKSELTGIGHNKKKIKIYTLQP